jgi:hypothetical protein
MVHSKGEFGTEFHMPTYSFEEVAEYFGNLHPRFVFQFLYDVFGCSLRLIGRVLAFRQENSNVLIADRIMLKQCLTNINLAVARKITAPGVALTAIAPAVTPTRSLWMNFVHVITNFLTSVLEKSVSTKDNGYLIHRSMFKHFIVIEIVRYYDIQYMC